MDFESKVFDEPLLEFGDSFKHPDPRRGLYESGPLQQNPGDFINVGVVGSSKTIEDSQDYFNDASTGIEGNSEKHPNLHPEFPGLGNQNPFRCRFEIDIASTSNIAQNKIDKICKEPNHETAVQMAVDEIYDHLLSLNERNDRPDVVIIALPVALIERVWNAKTDARSTSENEDSSGDDAPNFRGLLKAKAMDLGFPIQIVWEDVFDENVKIPRKIKESSHRDTQDRADLTWNLLPTLYYKGSGRIPWRRAQEEGEYPACYIGISFYREAGGQQLFTSAAQMFDELGRGFILKGNRAQTETRGKHPYMIEQDANILISNVLSEYKRHHRHYPSRVIVMKTSRFRDEEADGIWNALCAAEVELADLVWVQESYPVKVLRQGNYPVMRGTFVELVGKGLLYTNGSIPYYGTYPGQYDPRPLLLCPHPKSDSTVTQIAKEVFALTKVNWNSTQMNQRLPIPIRAARKVGEVLKYKKEGEFVSSEYWKYI